MYTVKELIEALKECPEDFKVLLVTDKPYKSVCWASTWNLKP